MNSAEKSQGINVKETLKAIPANIKLYSDKAIEKFKNLSKADIALFGAITACVGSIVGCIFSKSFKKVLGALSIVCGLGSAFLIYKKIVKDE